MTPKEKAEELFNKFYSTVLPEEDEYELVISKQCALIAVDELIECSKSYDNYNATWASQINYWQEVKKEIEAL